MIRPIRRAVLLAALSLIAVVPVTPALAAATHAHHKKAAAEKLAPDQKRVVVYRCAEGDCESAKPGRCPEHKVALKKKSVVRTWKCEGCGMTFKNAGICSMDNTPLTAYDVSYTCPADGKPVEHGGMCTRCDMDAKATLTKAPEAIAAKK